jgi:hypothetical protein
MKNTLLLPALFFISTFVNAQHKPAVHHNTGTHHPHQTTPTHPIKELDPWAISLSITPEQTKVSSGKGSIIGYTVGGQLGYFLNENMWLTTGLSYSRKGFSGDYLVRKAPLKGISTNINYFELPLYFSFRTGNFMPQHGVHTFKKIGLIISAGPVAGLLWDGNTKSGGQGHQIDKTDIKNAGYKNTIGFQAGIGGYFRISKAVFITLEPSYKMTFSSKQWSSIGLKLNIWYRLLEAHPL